MGRGRHGIPRELRPALLRLCIGAGALLALACGDSSPREETPAPAGATLEERIEATKKEIAALDKDADPERWGDLHQHLGSFFGEVGEGEAGTVSLQWGVEALRTALEARSREQDPFSWAKTQALLGRTLATLGERETEPAPLEEAVALLREAAQEEALKADPSLCASTHSALGRALTRLAERERDGALFDEATRAFKKALEILGPTGDPAETARVLDDLGVAYVRVAQASRSTTPLPRAVEVLRQALAVRAEARAAKPLEWAQTQHNLGEALHVWGMLDSDNDRLREAAVAYRAALEERTLSSAAAPAIGTRIGLGLALTTLALGGNRAELLAEAKGELEHALRDAQALGKTPPQSAQAALDAIEVEFQRRARSAAPEPS